MEIAMMICSFLALFVSVLTFVTTFLINKNSNEIKYNELCSKIIESFKIVKISINKNYVNHNKTNINNDEYDGKSKIQLDMYYDINMYTSIERLSIKTIDIHIQNYGGLGLLLRSDNPEFETNNLSDNMICFTYNVDRSKMDQILNSVLEDKLLVYTIGYNLKLKKFNNYIDFKKRDSLKMSNQNKDKIIYKKL